MSSKTADAKEHELLERLTTHPVLHDIDSLSPERFLAVLIQRRFISLIFSTIYDMGIDGLSDAEAIKLAREISREEYPDPSGETPSHREELMHDLGVLGATRGRVLAARPTPVTASVLTDTLNLMADAAEGAGDVKVLTMLRFWGEVVVSVEYGAYWKRMAGQFDPDIAPSRFYYEHYSHDGREPLASASALSHTHSGRLGSCLKRLLVLPGAGASFTEVETQVMQIRLRFYDQFLPVTGSDASAGTIAQSRSSASRSQNSSR
jgi:hypothetical protein